MPGSVMSSTSAVEVIIQAVSAPLRVSAPTRPGRVRGAGGGAEAGTAGAETAAAAAGPLAVARERRRAPWLQGRHWPPPPERAAAGAAGAWAMACWQAMATQIDKPHAITLFRCIHARLSCS